jgi:hypothetical protein
MKLRIVYELFDPIKAGSGLVNTNLTTITTLTTFRINSVEVNHQIIHVEASQVRL